MKKGKKIRLGVIGTGRIAKRFVPEARCVERIEVVAVYNPNFKSAKLFAEELFVGSYTDKKDEFIEKIDAVYIATPHEIHYKYAKEMLLEGKHVLCEKPMVFSKVQAEELFAIAREKKLVLMEGIKTAYCPGFQTLQQVIQSGKIGKIYDVEACFSKLGATNMREILDYKHGGSFLELGTYSMLPIMKLLGINENEVNFHSAFAINGTDIYTKASFDYGSRTALAKTGLEVKSEGQLVVAGSIGYILVQAPWWLTRHFEVRYENPNKKDVYEFPFEGQGLRYEIKAFVEQILDGVRPIVIPEESIWLAEKMELYLEYRNIQRIEQRLDYAFGNDCKEQEESTDRKDIKLWAHRGCSMAYPENTLEAFKAASEIEGLIGIELDIQLTRDGELVVIHDETVDRTTNGKGRVCDYTLKDLKELKIVTANGRYTTIPTLREVFNLLYSTCKRNRPEGKFQINIELKNKNIRYEGMEEKVIQLVAEYGLEENIIYSSFLPESMKIIKQINPYAKTGILGADMEQCRIDAARVNADAIHPWIGGLSVDLEEIEKVGDVPVRAYIRDDPFFGQKKLLKKDNLDKYIQFGVTDIITNIPEIYLMK